MFMNSRGKTIVELSREAGVSPSYFTRVFRLSFLGPDITKAILHGRHPAELTAKSLLGQSQLERDWSRQRVQLGLVLSNARSPPPKPRRTEIGAVFSCCGDRKLSCRYPAAVPPKLA